MVWAKKPPPPSNYRIKNAFDKVSHGLLWHKLLEYGIFLNIKSMYSKVKSCVRSNQGLTDLFLYKKELRQGCLLSPLLFALVLNDLNTFY